MMNGDRVDSQSDSSQTPLEIVQPTMDYVCYTSEQQVVLAG